MYLLLFCTCAALAARFPERRNDPGEIDTYLGAKWKSELLTYIGWPRTTAATAIAAAATQTAAASLTPSRHRLIR